MSFDSLRDGVPDGLPSVFGGAADDSDATNPHTWTDDRSKTWKDRVSPENPRQRFTLYAVIITLFGGLLFFSRFIPTTPAFLIGVGGAAVAPLAYYRGYERGFETFKRMDISIIYNPNSDSGLRIRAGEFIDNTDSGYVLFRPYSAESLMGLNHRFMKLKHIFGESVAPVKFGRGLSEKTSGDAPGENPVIDKLPAVFTADVSASAFGRVAVTLSSGLDERPRKKHYDREAELPTLASDETMADVRSYLTEITEIQIPALLRQLQIQEERAEGITHQRDRATKEYLDDLTTLVDNLPGGRRGRRSESSGSDSEDTGAAGGEIDLDAVRDIDSEVADRLEEMNGGESR